MVTPLRSSPVLIMRVWLLGEARARGCRDARKVEGRVRGILAGGAQLLRGSAIVLRRTTCAERQATDDDRGEAPARDRGWRGPLRGRRGLLQEASRLDVRRGGRRERR